MARNRRRVIGRAYPRFAQEEPGLFLTAFSPADERPAAEPPALDAVRSTPFTLLGDVLDDLVAAGALRADRRTDAEFTAGAAVHGLAMLLVRGPLHGLDPAHVARLEQHLLEVVERGL